MYSSASNLIDNKELKVHRERNESVPASINDLTEAQVNREYLIKDIVADDEDLKNFLFTLGCFRGEPVTLLSILAENYVITVKDARYSIDEDLAKAIRV